MDFPARILPRIEKATFDVSVVHFLLMFGSGKSGMMAKKFAKFKEEASTIDTIIVTLGPAIGSVIGGIAISKIGFDATFFWGGAFVLFFSFAFWFFLKEHS